MKILFTIYVSYFSSTSSVNSERILVNSVSHASSSSLFYFEGNLETNVEIKTKSTWKSKKIYSRTILNQNHQIIIFRISSLGGSKLGQPLVDYYTTGGTILYSEISFKTSKNQNFHQKFSKIQNQIEKRRKHNNFLIYYE